MGRSAYICNSQECIKEARQQNKLGRSLKTYIPEQIYQRLGERLSASIPEPQANE